MKKELLAPAGNMECLKDAVFNGADAVYMACKSFCARRFANNFDNNEIMHIAKYALDNDMTMNTYYFARAININENTRQSMENLSDDCIYLFRTVDNDNDKYSPYEFDLELYEADGYIVGTTFALND